MSTQFILENRFQFNMLGLLFQKRRGTDRADCREFILWHHIGSLVMLPFHFSLIVGNENSNYLKKTMRRLI